MLTALESLNQSALHEFGLNEDIGAFLISFFLELTRSLLGPATHDRAVAQPEQVEQLLGIVRDRGSSDRIGEHAIGTEDVVRILRSGWGDLPRANDPLRLVDRELGSLDEVGEVRLEEGKRAVKISGRRWQTRGDASVFRQRVEVLGELIEPFQASGIPLSPAGSCGKKLSGAFSDRSSSGHGAHDPLHKLASL